MQMIIYIQKMINNLKILKKKNIYIIINRYIYSEILYKKNKKIKKYIKNYNG